MVADIWLGAIHNNKSICMEEATFHEIHRQTFISSRQWIFVLDSCHWSPEVTGRLKQIVV